MCGLEGGYEDGSAALLVKFTVSYVCEAWHQQMIMWGKGGARFLIVEFIDNIYRDYACNICHN